jgi:hypothetical protein
MLVVVDFDVVRRVALGELHGFKNESQLLGLLGELDHVAGLDADRGDVDAAAVDLDVAVVDELARGEHRRHELGAVDDGVETALQQADEVFGPVSPFMADGFGVDGAELRSEMLP